MNQFYITTNENFVLSTNILFKFKFTEVFHVALIMGTLAHTLFVIVNILEHLSVSACCVSVPIKLVVLYSLTYRCIQ